MTFPKARLVVSACLFLGWLGFLLFLRWNARTVVLSKPQFLVAQAYVVVDIPRGGRGDLEPVADVTIDSVLWPETAPGGLKTQSIHLPDLGSCTKACGYQGAGKYLLPLMKTADSWILAPLPRLDFFPREKPTHGTLEAIGIFGVRTAWRLRYDEAKEVKKQWEETGYNNVALRAEELRIYVWNADTKAQVEELIAAKK